MKSRIGGKFFKKLSKQSTGKDKRLHLKIFLGNRYDRRRLKFLISFLFENSTNRPIIYDPVDNEELIIKHHPKLVFQFLLSRLCKALEDS